LKPVSGGHLMSLAGPLVLGALGKAPGAASMTGTALPALLSGTWPTVGSVVSGVTQIPTAAVAAAPIVAAAKPAATVAAGPVVGATAAVASAAKTATTAATTTASYTANAVAATAATATAATVATAAAATSTVATAARAAPSDLAKDVTRAAAAATAKEDHGGGSGWWLWPISLALIGGLAWAVWNMQMKSTAPLPAVKAEVEKVEKKVEKIAEAPKPAPAPAPAAAPEPVAAPAPAPAPVVAAPAAAVATAGADGMMRMALPTGPEISYAKDGVEGFLINFLTDSAKVVDKNIWYDFDRLQFETGSTNLTAESKSQVANVVEIMKAFPAAAVKIGGYTDNVGDPASNKKLSDDRAKAVAAAITAGGIDASRIEAEGYGEEHAAADNATAEGRAKNRRTAMSVRGK
jgi:OmpA-OmpF porin, OOP family